MQKRSGRRRKRRKENRSSANKVGSGGVCDDAMRCAGGSAWLQERSLSSNGNGEAQQANNLEGRARLKVWQGKARRGKARSRVPSCSGSPETGTLKSRPGGWWWPAVEGGHTQAARTGPGLVPLLQVPGAGCSPVERARWLLLRAEPSAGAQRIPPGLGRVVRDVCEVQRSQISVQCSAGLWVRSRPVVLGGRVHCPPL